MIYELDPKTARRRALSGAFAGAVAAVGPVVLGLVLLARTGIEVDPRVLAGAAAALFVLAALRTYVAFTRMRAELVALTIAADDDGLDVKTRLRKHRIPRAAIESIEEYPGALGGLRLDLAPRWDGTDRAPAYFDVPRGGKEFGELRAALERWKPVVPHRRRGRAMRVVVGVLVVLGLFFVPFLVADLGRSPLLAAAVVLVGWLAMRVALSRR